MQFNNHSDFQGKHAILSPSKHHWIHYDQDKFIQSYSRRVAQQRGTRFHDVAQRCITLGIRLPNIKSALNMYVNDAIGYMMKPEQILVYTENVFGCTDAISFREKKLRIHDLKTGTTRASMDQLIIYSALFCLEYGFKPQKIETELRIYQGSEIIIHIPEPEEILRVIDKIILFDKTIREFGSV